MAGRRSECERVRRRREIERQSLPRANGTATSCFREPRAPGIDDPAQLREPAMKRLIFGAPLFPSSCDVHGTCAEGPAARVERPDEPWRKQIVGPGALHRADRRSVRRLWSATSPPARCRPARLRTTCPMSAVRSSRDPRRYSSAAGQRPVSATTIFRDRLVRHGPHWSGDRHHRALTFSDRV